MIGFARRGTAGSIFDDDYTPPAQPSAVMPAGPGAEPGPAVPPADPAAGPSSPSPTPIPASAETSGQALAPIGEQKARRAVPDSVEQAKSRKLFKDIFAKELANHSTAARRALAGKLLKQAAGIGDAPVDRFVLLVGAAQAGKEGSDFDLCCQAVDALADDYQIDALRFKADSALKMSLRGDTPAASESNCGAGLQLVDQLMAVGDDATAFRLLQLLRAASPNAELGAAIQDRIKQIETSRRAAERVAPARQKLKTSPDDPTSNLAVGEYLCFTRDDWKAGLPLLVKGGNANLAAAAALDLAAPSDPQKQLDMADAWWAAAENQTGPARHAIRQRAANFYGTALESGTISGLKRSLAETRIAEAGSGPVGLHAAASRHVTILDAKYGAGERMASVTKEVQKALDADPFAPVSATTTACGTDPAPYVHKTLSVSYRVGGLGRTVEIQEGDCSLVPAIPDAGVPLPGASIPFKIIAARYGVDNNWLDVTDDMRKEITNPLEPIRTHNMAGGRDLHDGVVKHVVLHFEYHGRRFARCVADGEMMNLVPQ